VSEQGDDHRERYERAAPDKRRDAVAADLTGDVARGDGRQVSDRLGLRLRHRAWAARERRVRRVAGIRGLDEDVALGRGVCAHIP